MRGPEMIRTNGNDDENSEESLSYAVLAAVAAREGVDPSELSESLYDAIDPDALDEIFEGRSAHSGRRVNRLSFRYHGYDVTVYGDGRIELSPVADR